MISIKRISLKYIFPAVLFFIFSLLITSAYFFEFKNSQRELEKDLATEIQSIVGVTGISVSNSLMQSDIPQAESIISQTVLNTVLEKIAVISEVESVLLSTQYSDKNSLAKKVLPFYSSEMVKKTLKNKVLTIQFFNDDQDVIIYAPIRTIKNSNVLNRDFDTVIYGHYSLDSSTEDLRYSLLISLSKIIVLIAITLFVLIYIINYLVIRPLNKLVRTTNISDLSNHIEVTQNGVGEIGVLQKAFARLTGDVKRNITKLTESEERFVFALTSAKDGIWDWDIDADSVYYSTYWAQMLGLDKKVIGNDIDVWESRIHPDDLFNVLQDVEFHFSGRTDEIKNTHRILGANGQYRWILCRARTVSWDLKGYPSRLVGVNTDVTKYKEAQETINLHAQFDPITQLPNRSRLLAKLSQEVIRANANHQHGALIYIDCDQYKTVTDIKGHQEGDALLFNIARRLEEFKCETNFIAHLQGSEFVLLLTDINANKDLAAKCVSEFVSKMDKRLKDKIEYGDNEMIVSCSFGIELFSNELLSSHDILRQAAMAMKNSKLNPTSNVSFFEKGIGAKLLSEHELELAMHHALDANEFSLFFQPRQNKEGHLIGAEALSRWIHSEKGWVSPAEFIKVAEQSGLILKLGNWVIESVFTQLACWEEKGLPDTFTTLSLNVSPLQMMQDNFIQKIKDELKRTKISPHLIEIEITEATFLNESESIINKMKAIRALGIRFAIDDFGVGYSSFSYLSCLPVSTLKIDQSFVFNLLEQKNQGIIVAAIIGLSHKLAMNVVAEGVETKEQLDLLYKFGCNEFQGFYISAPMAKKDFQTLLFKK